MALTNYERMINLVNEVFAMKKDPAMWFIMDPGVRLNQPGLFRAIIFPFCRGIRP